MDDADTRARRGAIPSLTYRDPLAAQAWLARVFGWQVRLSVDDGAGGVRHSELSLGDAVVFVSGERPEEGRYSPLSVEGAFTSMSVRVDDVDAHHARAVAAGARLLQPLEDTPFGARGYMVADCDGHRWYFTDYVPGSFWDAAD